LSLEFGLESGGAGRGTEAAALVGLLASQDDLPTTRGACRGEPPLQALAGGLREPLKAVVT
jgi:hypothetical protein